MTTPSPKRQTRQVQPSQCELCGRAARLTFHHLVPRKVHKRTRYIQRHGRDAMRSTGLWLCKLCHSGIHTIIPNEKVLAESYYTKELLLGHEGIARHVAWARKQK
jgi:hypothetical protein